MKQRIAALLLALFFALSCANMFAHSGRTDSSGGHYNRSTGEYHYHHGYSAHQHPGGVCPYDYDDRTGWNSGSSSSRSDDVTYAVFGETPTPSPTPKPTATPKATPYSYYVGKTIGFSDTPEEPVPWKISKIDKAGISLLLAIFGFLIFGVWLSAKRKQTGKGLPMKDRIKSFLNRHQWITNILGFAAIVVGLTLSVLLYNFLFGYLPKKYSEDDMIEIKDEAYHEGYDNGYDDGYDDGGGGFFNGYDSGYEDGHVDGYKEGYDDGCKEGYANCKVELYPEWYDTGVDAGYSAGFADGYNTGYEHRDEHIDQYTSGMLPLLWGEKPYSSRNNLPELAVGSYKPGVYTASAFGFGGIVEVEVVISANGRIVEVNIDAPNETLGIGSRAIEELPEQIIVTQGVNMDVVTGATRTSKAILDPVTNILTKQAIQ